MPGRSDLARHPEISTYDLLQSPAWPGFFMRING
jgi:hypothetical protein